jgi:phosphotransferase system  glucose/maltose/N-acetylglucosamine-specific IIC component
MRRIAVVLVLLLAVTVWPAVTGLADAFGEALPASGPQGQAVLGECRGDPLGRSRRLV